MGIRPGKGGGRLEKSGPGPRNKDADPGSRIGIQGRHRLGRAKLGRGLGMGLEEI